MKTAIIAGHGQLPLILGRALTDRGVPFVFAPVMGAGAEVPAEWAAEPFAVERLALFHDRLHELGVTRVVLAGALTRVRLEPEKIDPKTAMLLPRVLPALQQGDDALLRTVIALFEEDAFEVTGAETICPDLLPAPGVTGPQPSRQDKADAARAADLVALLGQADVGQGAVVAQGQCLALETLPGTDAMLGWVADVAHARRPDPKGARGILYKACKPGQDRRVDLPAIGPDTISNAAAAGLAGVVLEAGGVMVLDSNDVETRLRDTGLFLWVRQP
ncbi:hypothetical protein C8N32_105137 [Rhodovulum imhoffii]|uniref:Phosphatidate cytidylyltransferase n=1 Tax=Rhodovulum imhoffii TaxID=365340 RepID=A0A2T5BTK8_9RHOB|nr:UDP-2,3-diacylglucosamine diphosphatase LpxI [Rhodovulum imhoffii]PTN02765.1 hypothetical protein C8N32_105137 [Rhodovulum imhoffii]